ncbi:cell wall-binding repeat-containing protein [Ornithinimicrobium ciconiae]|uniref:cell wall-binding repeat-containing protein n=1 Tax=Ornithinimicrobium ciconiae TaxID=2594265 RepID=UPI0013FCF97B|nr:cell wall-binding repeat-containing protein [Ornithinimicrobium ciconiae]
MTVLLAAAITVSAPSGLGGLGTTAATASPAAAPVLSALDGTEDDLGARALKGDSWSRPAAEPQDFTRYGPVFPVSPPFDELHRNPVYYSDGCHAPRWRVTVVPGCTYGDTTSNVTVAVVGSSKIGQYFPALEEIALREGWSLRMYTKTACDFVMDAPPTPNYPQCDLYNTALREHLQNNPPDLAITGGMRTDTVDGYANAWRFLENLRASQIGAVWDTPVPLGDPDRCVAEALIDRADLTRCAQKLDSARSGNPGMREAAWRVKSASFINLRDWVCPESWLSPDCAMVVGRAQIYAEGSHLSQGYAATLTDPLHQRLHEAGIAQFRPSVDRVAGADRYATAALLSRDVTPGGRVLVASGTDYPDALAAAAKAGHTDGAVLLTRGTSLPQATREALIRLAPSEIVVAGGRSAISADVVQELQTLGAQVRRVEGPDRYATAAEISTLTPVRTEGVVYVATGTGFADALAAAAQAGQSEAAVLLVRPGSIPSATAEALRELRPRQIVVAGGNAAVSQQVVNELRGFATEGVERRGGANRYETAALLAQDTPPGGVLHVGVGSNFADSLAAAPASAAAQGAVLLVASGQVPGVTAEAIRALEPSRIVLAGGTAAVSEKVKRALIRLTP